jgi:acetylornithine deacetylase
MIKKDVLDYIDEHASEIVSCLKTMIAIPSVNDGVDYRERNERQIQEWIAADLARAGLAVDKWAEDPAGLRPNVVATLKGSGGGNSLILNGHCDVVPVLEPNRWHTDPFVPVERDGNIYGRGASDMKGGLAAVIWAAKAVAARGVRLKGDLYIASTVGEETGEGATIGTAAVIRRGYKAPFAIVAEPTDLELQTASSGIFVFELIVRGKAVHGACRNQVIFPQRYGLASGQAVGVDALQKALPIIDMIYRMEQDWNLNWRHPVVGAGGQPFPDSQGVGVFCINPAFIEGGIYRASINPYVKITYMVWHPPTIRRETVIEEIKKNVAAIASADSWLRENPPEVNAPAVRAPWDPFATPESCQGVKALQDTMKKLSGKDATISGFKAVSDCTWLERAGIPSVLLGPGNLGYGVHGDNEFVPIRDVIEAARIYAAFVLDWCSAE